MRTMTKWQLWCDALHHLFLLFKRSKSCANKFASFQTSHNSHIHSIVYRVLYAVLSFSCGMWVNFFRLQFPWIISLRERERAKQPNSSHLNGCVLMLSTLMEMMVELYEKNTLAQSICLCVCMRASFFSYNSSFFCNSVRCLIVCYVQHSN